MVGRREAHSGASHAHVFDAVAHVSDPEGKQREMEEGKEEGWGGGSAVALPLTRGVSFLSWRRMKGTRMFWSYRQRYFEVFFNDVRRVFDPDVPRAIFLRQGALPRPKQNKST